MTFAGPGDPVGVSPFGYVVGGSVVVDLRLKFGWRNRNDCWGLIASALEHAHTRYMFQDAAVSPRGAGAVEPVRVASSRSSPVASFPRHCQLVRGVGGNAGSYFFVRY